MMDFNYFPVELHRQILCVMDPEDILALRKTSKYFLALTHEPRLWTSIYYRMRQTHTLSCSQSEFAALPPWQPERLLVRVSKTEKTFQTFREHPQHRIFPSGQTRKTGPLVALSFLSERFLLSVDDTTVVYVWDMSKLASSTEAPAFPCTRLTLVGWRFITYSMSNDHSTLYVVLSKATKVHVFSLTLPLTTLDGDEPKLSFHDIAYFDTHMTKVDSIDADSCLVFLQLSHSLIRVMDWRTEDGVSILLHQEPTEAPSHRGHVLALRLCGPYVLCFRRWSIDAYALPKRFLPAEHTTEQPLPVLQHTMPGMAFTKICLSRVVCNRSLSGDVIVYTLCALAEEPRRGTYYYQVDVQTTPVPALSIRLLGMDSAHANGGVSVWDLGSTGRRGAWVPAYRSGKLHVVAFTTPSPQSQGQYSFESTESVGSSSLSLSLPANAGLDVPRAIAPRFEARVVSVSSLDLGDIVTQCAVSEFTGRIALGSWTGAITVL